MEWYHEMLCHPGAERMEHTICQHLVWPGCTKDIEKHVRTCHLCQIYKTHCAKYEYLSPKVLNDIPWHTVCIDQIGPYEVTDNNGTVQKLNAMTMVDPATGWFKIIEVPDKQAETAAKLFDRVWLCRYP